MIQGLWIGTRVRVTNGLAKGSVGKVVSEWPRPFGRVNRGPIIRLLVVDLGEASDLRAIREDYLEAIP